MKKTHWAALILISALAGISTNLLIRPSGSSLEQVELPFTDQYNQKATLNDWGTQWRLINFWAEWCPPCTKEIPLLKAIHPTLIARNATLIGISMESAESNRAASERFQINYPSLANEVSAIALSKRFGNRAGVLPYTVLLSPENEVIVEKLGELTEADLRNIVKKIPEMR